MNDAASSCGSPRGLLIARLGWQALTVGLDRSNSIAAALAGGVQRWITVHGLRGENVGLVARAAREEQRGGVVATPARGGLP